MIGTFSPQAEPYTHEMPEETTPSGLFARGTYSAKTKVSFSYVYNYYVCFLILMFQLSLCEMNMIYVDGIEIYNICPLSPNYDENIDYRLSKYF